MVVGRDGNSALGPSQPPLFHARRTMRDTEVFYSEREREREGERERGRERGEEEEEVLLTAYNK